MKMLTLRNASTEYNISYYSLRKLCNEGQVPFVRVGNKFLISDVVLEDFLKGESHGEQEILQ